MIHMMGEWRVVLMQEAIFTSSPGPFVDQPAERGRNFCPPRHRLISGGQLSTRPRLENQQHVVDLLIHVEFSGFLVSQAVLAILV